MRENLRPIFHGRLLGVYKLIRPQKGEYILDVGCSTGYFARGIWRKNFIVGVDLFAYDEWKKSNKDLYFCISSATHLPFKNATFDKIAMLEIIEHLDGNELKALKEARRVLKKGGLLILSTPHKGKFSLYLFLDPASYVLMKHRHFSISEIESLLRKAGFNNIKIYTGGLFAEQISYLITIFIKICKVSAHFGIMRTIKKIAFKGSWINHSKYHEVKFSLAKRFLQFLWKISDLEYIKGIQGEKQNYYSIIAVAKKL